MMINLNISNKSMTKQCYKENIKSFFFILKNTNNTGNNLSQEKKNQYFSYCKIRLIKLKKNNHSKKELSLQLLLILTSFFSILISVTFLIATHSSGVMVSKLDLQNYTSEFESQWVPHSYGPVPHLSKKLSKLQLTQIVNSMTTKEQRVTKTTITKVSSCRDLNLRPFCFFLLQRSLVFRNICFYYSNNGMAIAQTILWKY